MKKTLTLILGVSMFVLVPSALPAQASPTRLQLTTGLCVRVNPTKPNFVDVDAGQLFSTSTTYAFPANASLSAGANTITTFYVYPATTGNSALLGKIEGNPLVNIASTPGTVTIATVVTGSDPSNMTSGKEGTVQSITNTNPVCPNYSILNNTVHATSTPGVGISKNLSMGMRDPEVTTLQTYLLNAGFLKTNSSGYFGALTLEAVKAFQQKNGISPTGYVGPLTRALIQAQMMGTR